jgi:hypothetical protein
MAQKETHILIAVRGYLDDEVRVEKIVIDENEIGVEFDDFEEYADYILEVAADKYEQGFSEVLIIQESQLPKLLEELVRIQRVTN